MQHAPAWRQARQTSRCGSPLTRYPIHQVDQPVIINAAVLAQANLTGTAGGDAFAALLNRIFQCAQ